MGLPIYSQSMHFSVDYAEVNRRQIPTASRVGCRYPRLVDFEDVDVFSERKGSVHVCPLGTSTIQLLNL